MDSVQYEILYKICKKCGIIGHISPRCRYKDAEIEIMHNEQMKVFQMKKPVNRSTGSKSDLIQKEDMLENDINRVHEELQGDMKSFKVSTTSVLSEVIKGILEINSCHKRENFYIKETSQSNNMLK